MNKIYISLISFILISCGGGGGGGSPSSPSGSVSISSNASSALVGTPVTISWSSQNSSSCSASGAWSGSKQTSGSESITISIPGNNTFSLSCSGSGGSSSNSVTVEGYRETKGFAVDGYIRSADIFIDANNNYQLDSGEESDISGNDGKFIIKYANGNLLSFGGFDLDTGNLLSNYLMIHKMNGYSENKVITPVTSVAAFMQSPANINTVLGIDSSIDVHEFDPVFNKGDGGINDYLYEKGNQLTFIALSLQYFINSKSLTNYTTEDMFTSLAEEIENEFSLTSNKVDIENSVFIKKVLSNILISKDIQISESDLNNVVLILESVIPIFEVRSDENLSNSLFNFAITTMQSDLLSISDGSIDSGVLNSYTSNVLNYIAEDQNVDPDKLAPQITAINNEASVDEDNTVSVNVLVNDSFLSYAPISITVSDPPNGTATVVDNIVEYLPDQDYNGTDIFNYTIYQGDKTSTAEVLVNIAPINDAPVVDSPSILQAPENQTFVNVIEVSDVDIGDTLSVSITGTDASLFILNETNSLNFVDAPDYESTNVFYLTVEVTDGIIFTVKDIEIQVTNINDVPPVISSSNTINAKEMCKSVSVIEASDIEGDALSWTLSGDDAALFSIGFDTGLISFIDYPRGADPDDSSVDNLYDITVEVFDGVHLVTQEIDLTLMVDPLYPHQWILENTGQKNFADLDSTPGADMSVMGANCAYSGKGVTVAVIDTGLELAHEDLVDNVVDGSIDWVNSDNDPTSESLYGDHGTACGGIIAMKGHNNIGGRGVAPDANLVGYNWLNSQSDSNLIASFTGNSYEVELGVTNNSWGRGLGDYYMPPEWDNVMTDISMPEIINLSRSGKGTIHVKSNGNSFYSSDGWCGPNAAMSDEMPCTTSSSSGGLHITPFIIGVPSLNANDERSSYSTVGPSSWTAGYGGEFGYGPPNYDASNYSDEQQRYFKAAVMSTDQSTCDIGYVRTENDAGTPRNAFSTGDHPLNLECHYMPHMNGTSAAGPTVAGVVALLMEVNPEFTWRDIKHVLANAGKIVDENRTKSLTYGSTDISMHSWVTNAAGYSHHNWFGFGKLDVTSAINFAENMTPNNLGTFTTYDLVDVDTDDNDWTMDIADQIQTHSIALTSNDGSNGKVEWVRVRVWFDYPDMSDIGLRMTSPDGTTINILYPYAYKTMNPKDLITEYGFDEYYFDIGIAGFYGENITGDWTLEVINWESGGCPEVTDDDGNVSTVCTTGKLENWGILMYGN